MIRQVHQAARRKISDFIRLEEGRVSHRRALTAAAIVTTSALAGVLLAPQPALAVCQCVDGITCSNAAGWYCCWLVWTDACGPGYDWTCAPYGQINHSTGQCL